MKTYLLLFVIFAVFIISSCTKKTEVKTTENKKDAVNTTSALSEKGKVIFNTESEKTGLKCADCHSDGTNDKNLLVKYFATIKGADKRTSSFLGMFKDAEVVKNAGGASYCWKTYLRNKTPLTEEEINALNAYYKSVSKGDEPAELKYTTLALPKANKDQLKIDQAKIAGLKGDIANGEKVFNNSCAFCHGKDSRVKDVPSLFKNFDGSLKSIAYNVRIGSKYMPFFTYEVLSDQELADVTSYILGNQK